MRRPSNRRPADPGAGGFDTRPPPLMAADGTARLQDWEDNEPRRALDGGRRGTTVLVRAAQAAARWLRPGGSVLLEIGGDQASEVATTLANVGLTELRVHRDGDRQDRAIEAQHPGASRSPGISVAHATP